MRERILLLIFSLLAAFLLVEAGYRIKLWFDLRGSLARPSYGVLSQSLHEFSEPFGYGYAAGKTVHTVEIRDGAVKECLDVRIDGNGNLDSGIPAGSDSATILVFGDSFTANPYQPLGWPRYFAEMSGFHVVNYGRDGYGLLQMFHLAATQVQRLRPDFVIFAFIVDDISRERVWRSTVPVQGQPTEVVSIDPKRFEDPSVAMEVALIDPAVTPEWCNAPRSGGSPKDPALRRLNERFRGLSMRRHNRYLRVLDKSLLVNFLRRRDPYFGMHVPSRNPEISALSFENDAQMRRDIQSIDVPMCLIVLPRYDDLVRRQLMGNRQRIALLASLQRIAGISPVLLLNEMNLEGVNVESLFLVPEDNHPTPAGSRAYADAIFRVMKDGGWIDSLRN